MKTPSKNLSYIFILECEYILCKKIYLLINYILYNHRILDNDDHSLDYTTNLYGKNLIIR